MLLTTEVEIKLNGYRNIKYLENNGYIIPYSKDKFGRNRVSKDSSLLIKIEHLPLGSKKEVEILCDYCKEEVIKKQYQRYLKENKDGKIQTDCCSGCRGKKQEESMTLKHGVSNPMYLQSAKDKKDITNLEKYGYKSAMQNLDIKSKTQQTNIERYGFITPLLNDEVHAKVVASNQLNYGVDNVFENQDIKDAIRQSLYKNDSAPCSCQQRYLYQLLGGELNYPLYRYSLDIAFLDEKIYLEYDGNGHDMQVIMGNITKEEFDRTELKRYYFLKNRGWSGIRFISLKNRFPSDEIIIDLIKTAKEYIKSGHSWFEIDIDKNELRCSDYTKSFDFGKLRWIKKRNL